MPKRKEPFTGYNSELAYRAKELRKSMTPEERHLWYDFLRTYPIKIYRQRVIDRYIVDFYCSSAKLVIEIDGSQHYTADGIEYDSIRSEVLSQYGLEVIRFSNSDINRHFRSVCEAIDIKIRRMIGMDKHSQFLNSITIPPPKPRQNRNQP
ncbi:MAG: endonuclease domain-containing protein [Oscillospiraceae bacterium]|nr:endonuclease domain-containing protein [Oscillospiraceae bacterium]